VNRFSSFFYKFPETKIIAIFFSIGILIYSNILFNGFIADDFPQIVNNPSVHSISKIPSLFSQGTAYDENNLPRSSFYRPFFSSTFSVIYLFSGHKPFLFHAVQILFHIANVILLYLIFSYFFNRKVAFLLSLVFLVHPLNTEAVGYISSLQDPLFLFFGLSVIYLLIRDVKNFYYYLLGAISLILSLLSKEGGVVFIILVPMFAYLFNKKDILKASALSLSAIATYFVLRLIVARIYLPKGFMVPIMSLSFWERIAHIPKIIFFYLQTFLFPKNLIMFQTWTIKSINFPNFYFPLIVELILLSLLIILGIKLYRKDGNLFKSLIFFSLFFFLGLGLHLQIIPLDQTVSDRWFYFPMVGLLGMMGVLAKYLNLDEGHKFRTLVFVMIGVITILSVRVVARNTNWKNESTLYTHDIKYNTDSFQLEKGLAVLASQKGDFAEAEKHYIRSTELFPSSNTFSGIAIYYLKNKKYEKAANNFTVALDHDPNSAYNWLLMAVSKYGYGDRDGAILAAEKAYSITPTKGILSILNSIKNGENIKIQ